ncbi:sodium/glutamate symporter [Leptotrichia sp. oral taxon 218]|uniref:sodium/glutamate symporter n=1 Tax=Leptotrichia sp. oral taxon 218 TaxID=712361 RepID=UPI001B8BC685|nr:sodium/glutamate symporter [Leptotrichia sp. oral taxon 218]QUB94647.1 sodium/glutamate symporter [Leptotrichia sp. oral taxon 218]
MKLDMIQTIGLSVILLLIGMKLRKKVKFFEKYCIPSPVIGGFLFSIISFILRQTEIVEISFDDTLQKFFMIMFFTSVGFNASLKLLKKGGKKVLIFLFVAIGLCILQNVVPILLSGLVGLKPLLALMTGSVAMTGGHGTSAAVAPEIEKMGYTGAKAIAIASATYGLIVGSMLGGPIASRLIKKHKLLPEHMAKENVEKDIDEEVLKKQRPYLDGERFSMAFFYILIAMGIGSYLSLFINFLLPAMKFPVYIGPMIVAAIIRNISDNVESLHAPTKEISILEDISLSLFLAMALMSLRLWDLIDLAGPVIILLLAQTLLIYLYLNFVTFKSMGSNYDAAVIVSGHCGFGMGATPNGISNMKAITEKYIYSKIAFFVIPIVGSLFIDFANISVITFFEVTLKRLAM